MCLLDGSVPPGWKCVMCRKDWELQKVCQVYTVAGVNDLYATCSGSCRHVN